MKIYILDTGNGRIVRINDMTGAGWTAFGGQPKQGARTSDPCGNLTPPGLFEFIAPKGIRLWQGHPWAARDDSDQSGSRSRDREGPRHARDRAAVRLRNGAGLLFDLLRTRVASAGGILGRTCQADVFGEGASAFTQDGIGQPRSTPLGNIQRLAQPQVELLEDRIGLPDEGAEPPLHREAVAREIERAQPREADDGDAVGGVERVDEAEGPSRRLTQNSRNRWRALCGFNGFCVDRRNFVQDPVPPMAKCHIPTEGLLCVLCLAWRC